MISIISNFLLPFLMCIISRWSHSLECPMKIWGISCHDRHNNWPDIKSFTDDRARIFGSLPLIPQTLLFLLWVINVRVPVTTTLTYRVSYLDLCSRLLPGFTPLPVPPHPISSSLAGPHSLFSTMLFSLHVFVFFSVCVFLVVEF